MYDLSAEKVKNDLDPIFKVTKVKLEVELAENT